MAKLYLPCASCNQTALDVSPLGWGAGAPGPSYHSQGQPWTAAGLPSSASQGIKRINGSSGISTSDCLQPWAVLPATVCRPVVRRRPGGVDLSVTSCATPGAHCVVEGHDFIIDRYVFPAATHLCVAGSGLAWMEEQSQAGKEVDRSTDGESLRSALARPNMDF